MKSQVIGICGDAVPRAVQKDALTSRRHTAGGEYLAVPIGRTQERLAPCLDSDRGDGPEALAPQGTTVNPGVVCPAVAYQQGAADHCVAFGAASAVLHDCEHTTAAAIAGVGDALGFVRDFFTLSTAVCTTRRLKSTTTRSSPLSTRRSSCRQCRTARGNAL